MSPCLSAFFEETALSSVDVGPLARLGGLNSAASGRRQLALPSQVHDTSQTEAARTSQARGALVTVVVVVVGVCRKGPLSTSLGRRV